MALTAKFQADFSSFYKAVQDATAKLEGFQQEADQVSKSLDRMVDTLSGKRLISNATLMVKAVEEIGGASRLTDTELKKISATVGEAAAKMDRMGIAIPKSFTEITKAAEGVNKPTESWGSTLTNVTNIVRGFMALQLVSWMKEAVSAGMEWASAMAKMRAQTDLTFRDLQVLEDVSINTGTALGTLTKSVQVLQERIGNRTARQGIQELGLSFDAILAMKPADQFAAIATAIGKIEDPNIRGARAAKIFGNTYREIMPALRADLSEIANATKVIGDTQIEAADRASARWEKFWNDQKKGWAAWAGSLIEGVEQGSKAWDEANRRGAESRARLFGGGGGGGLPTLPAAPGGPAVGGGATVNDVIDPTMISRLQVYGRTLEQTAAHTETKTAADKKAATAQADYAKAVDASLERVRFQHYELGKAATAASSNVAGFTIRMSETVGISRDFSKELTASTIKTDHFGHVLTTNVNPTLGKMGQGIINTTGETVTFDKTLDELAKSFAMLGQISGGALGKTAQTIGTVITSMQVATNAGKSMKAGLTKGGVEGYGQLAEGAIAAVGAIDAATNSGKKAINVMGGMAAGAKAGMAFGPYGAAIGAAAGAIAGFVKANSFEGKYVSPLRDEFFKMAGGLDLLNPKVQQLTGNMELVKAVFDAKTVEDYNAAIGKLNDLFAEEQNAIATLSETAARYGLTLEELGPAMQRQQLDKQAQALYKDWQVLNAAGIQTTVITARMAESINKYTNDARAMGVEVPSAMRPMIEKMIEMGQLTDANGNKVESLESSGISFALTMSEGFQSLIKSVDKLADVLSRSLGTAIKSTTAQLNAIPSTIPINVKYTTSGTPPPKGSVPGYATGTDGFVDFGAGTLAMLHGREAVIPENAVAKFGGGGGGGVGAAATVSITVNAQGAFFDTPGDLQRLADKVNDALTAKYGLTNRNRAA